MIDVPKTAMRDSPNPGRPRGNYRLFKNSLKSILFIAKAHDIEPKQLIDAFVEAWTQHVAHCGGLTIRRRAIDQDAVTFLLTKQEKVISQFPIKQEALRAPDSFLHYVEATSPPPSVPKERLPHPQKISELKAGMTGVEVTGTIREIPLRKLVDTRWGGQSYVSNISIADDTGSIQLSLWNHQIDRVHVGDVVEIENGYVASFAGEPQLRLGRKGTLSTIH